MVEIVSLKSMSPWSRQRCPHPKHWPISTIRPCYQLPYSFRWWPVDCWKSKRSKEGQGEICVTIQAGLIPFAADWHTKVKLFEVELVI